MDVLYYGRHPHSEAEKRYDDRLLRSRYLAGVIGFRLPDFTLDGTDASFNQRRQIGENEARRHPYQCGPRPGAALENRRLLAAGLDVFEQEPLPDTLPLLRLPNVVVLPHIGSATHETRYNMAADAVNNLITALTGRVEKIGLIRKLSPAVRIAGTGRRQALPSGQV